MSVMGTPIVVVSHANLVMATAFTVQGASGWSLETPTPPSNEAGGQAWSLVTKTSDARCGEKQGDKDGD